jgi:hypothetical protein
MSTFIKAVSAAAVLAAAAFFVRKAGMNSTGAERVTEVSPLANKDRDERSRKSQANPLPKKGGDPVVKSFTAEQVRQTIAQYKDLSKAGSGPDLRNKQIEFLQNLDPALAGKGAFDFYQEIQYTSSDAVIAFAANTLGARLFQDGIEAGLEALKDTQASPVVGMFVAIAGAYLGNRNLEDILSVANSKTLQAGFKRELVAGALVGRSLTMGLDPSSIDLIARVASNGTLTKQDLLKITSRAGENTDFNYLWSSLNGGRADKDIQSAIVSAWANANPSACLASLEQQRQSNPELLEQNAAVIARKWTDSDPVAAGAWINNLPPSKLKDNVSSEMSFKMSQLYPGESIDWALSVQDPDARTRTLKRLRDTIIKAHGPENAEELFRSKLSSEQLETIKPR